MKAWDSAEWFVKWLELARIKMGDAAAESNLTGDNVQGADTGSAFGCAQLGETEEHKLAA
jgi:hypothetical protein